MQKKQYPSTSIITVSDYSKIELLFRKLGFFIIFILASSCFIFLAILLATLDNFETSATEISIEQIEESGFPDAKYLTINNAYVVFSEAHINRKSDSSEINDIYVPVVSLALLEKWQTSINQNKQTYASVSRLFVKFKEEQIAHLEGNEHPYKNFDTVRKSQAIKMIITGDTRPLQGVFLSEQYAVSKVNKHLNWNEAGVLQYQVQFNNLERVIKYFVYFSSLLTLTIYLFIKYRKLKQSMESQIGKGSDTVKNSDWSATFKHKYETKVLPQLKTMEAERVKARRSRIIRHLIHLPLAILGVILIYNWLDNNPGFITNGWLILFLWIIAAIFILSVYLYVHSPVMAYEEKWENFLPQVACDAIDAEGISYSRTVTNPVEHKLFSRLSLIPKMHSSTIDFEDTLYGTVKDVSFNWMECTVTKLTNKPAADASSYPIFKGSLMTIQMESEFKGLLRILPTKKGEPYFATKENSTAVCVEIEDDEFNDYFHVYSRNKTEDLTHTKQLLSPGFIEALTSLAKLNKNGGIAAAFYKDQFLMSIETEENLFEHFDSSKTIDEMEGIMQVSISDIKAIHQLVESVIEVTALNKQ